MNGRHLLLFSFALAAFQAFASEPTQPPSSQSRQASTAFDGRVFFSASERRALETKPAAPNIPPPQAVAPPPPKRRFDGLLWRDGRIVALWFDGVQADPATEPAIRIGEGIPVTTVSGRRQTLLPGQSWPPQGRNSEP
ncbi:MAG: hypothetical protein LBE62_10295 [Azonexus sp.]|jgi:hypothetical protein|nr:hypothetical protein [Azonexus sp.]